jgi:predicted DNA-binding ArsR family transcriptional regulator
MLMMALTCIKDSVQAEMMSVKTMKEVQNKIEEVLKNQKPENVLVAFDVDMTLTQPNHPAIYYPTIKKYVDVYKSILGQLTPAQKDLAATLTTQIVPQKLVEENTPKIIQNIQKQDVKVIALTSSLAGKIEGFPDKMIVLRRGQLQKMGFDFTNTLKKFVGVMTFHDFKEYAGGHPMFYHGILSTNGEGDVSKGDLLVVLLTHVGTDYEDKVRKPVYYPKVIILVDDKKKHLANTEARLKAYDPSIQFIGIEYEGAFAYAPQDISKEDFQKFWEDLANKAISMNRAEQPLETKKHVIKS